MNFRERFAGLRPGRGEIAVAFVGQAGMLFKDPSGAVTAVDPYLGNGCEAAFGFARMTPPPMRPEELDADIYCVTHSHMDHLDPDVLRHLAPRAFCIGATDCREEFRRAGVPTERCALLRPGERATVGGTEFRATFADHGDLAPEAVGFEIRFGCGVGVYVTGDTAYREEEMASSLSGRELELMFVPINPAFGNPGAENAVRLAARIAPRRAVGVHFDMFREHGGDPEEFRRRAEQMLPEKVKYHIPVAGTIFLCGGGRFEEVR